MMSSPKTGFLHQEKIIKEALSSVQEKSREGAKREE